MKPTNILKFEARPEQESEDERNRRIAQTVEKLRREALLRAGETERAPYRRQRHSDWCDQCEGG